MIKLIVKSLKSFVVDKKILFILLVLSLVIGNLIYFNATKQYLQDKESLYNLITFSIYGLNRVDEIEDVLNVDDKYMKFIGLSTYGDVVDLEMLDESGSYAISCDLLDPNLDKVKYISGATSKEGIDRYIILSKIGQRNFTGSTYGGNLLVNGEKVLYLADGDIKYPEISDGTLNKEAFFEIFGKKADRGYIVFAYYSVDISDKEFDNIVSEIKSMGIEPEIYKYKKLSYKTLFTKYGDSLVLVSLIICLIMYGHYIDSRLRDYAIFRMVGISRIKLMLIYIIETLLLHTVSYVSMSCIWLFVIKVIFNQGTFNFGKIMFFGYGILLIAYTLINLPYLKRISGKSAIELYRKSRRIG